MHIASVATAYPAHRYPQAAITETLKDLFQGTVEPRLMERLHANCGVDFRHLMLPLEDYGSLSGFGSTNDIWMAGALDLGQRAITEASERAGITPAEISAIFFASNTGISMPSVDARLSNVMEFPAHIKRTPMFGLGCVAGATGIARAADYVRAFPKAYAVLLCVELCSLTWQSNDPSVGNIVACGLFGDGAAAVILAGDETPVAQRLRSEKSPCPRVIDTRSALYRDTEHLVGWKVKDNGFNVVVSAQIPSIVNQYMRQNVDEFLADNGLTLPKISSFIFHGGGRKVLEAFENCLELPLNALRSAWKNLRDLGNLSSVSVLAVLEDHMMNHPDEPGAHSMLAAMGPAFCSELVLLQW